ncbi:PAS domain-containing protein [Asticcacaulis sp. EMRT-3]|uniref:PAS domain-containing protein n=1 Tax=Asticcacaulis sp. EMRT-3 TaxID=3040349 RepID=UPI0024AF1398|nr:PAS domain-containing protein [Asticcacaulis sp. EMRT-3]MDI7774082.1 PAS domain-containing protein [Asticcacaulis sp. EMRT-3]
MPHSSTVAFLSYWRGLQPEPGQAPLRERFDPSRLKHLIPQMMMISTADARHGFRLSGGFLVALHGHELKDTPFLDRFLSPFADTVAAALALSRRREQPLLLTLSAPWRTAPSATPQADLSLFQNETVSFEICLCPMRNAAGKVDRLVGIYQTLSPMPRNPNGRLGRYTLVASRLYEPERQVRAAHLQLVVIEGKRIA